MLLVLHLKTHQQIQGHIDFSLVFSRYLMLLHFTCRSYIHFELILGKIVNSVFLFIAYYYYYYFLFCIQMPKCSSGPVVFEKQYFILWIASMSLWEVIDCLYLGLLWAFYCVPLIGASILSLMPYFQVILFYSKS